MEGSAQASKMARISVSVPKHVHEKVEEFAKSQGMSSSGVVRLILLKWYEYRTELEAREGG